MTYRIKNYNDWNIRYSTPNGQLSCRNVDSNEYFADSEYLAGQIIKDLLDPPEAELTLEMVEREFSEPSGKWKVPEENLVGIKTYYNGRFALYQKILKDLDLNNGRKNVFKYEIPYQYNHFEVSEQPPPEERQRDSYIEIEIS